MFRRMVLGLASALVVFLAGYWSGATQSTTVHAQNANRTFELRVYHTYDGKLDDLLKRFREHTTMLFERHKMTNVGYWVPTDEPLKGKTLFYMLAFPSREDAKKDWAAFQNDPDWKKARAASEANGKIVEKVDSYFLEPTDFSRVK
jgi:hypothetical protein